MHGEGDKIEQLSTEKQESIKGGAISVWTGIIIAALAVFLSGIIEGITNPTSCNE